MNKSTGGAWELIKHYIKPIQHILNWSDVSEICINKFDEVYVEQKGKIEAVNTVFKSEHEVATLIKCIANALGIVCNEDSHPILDARLQDGSRICGILYPVAVHGSSLTIRVFPEKKLNSQDLLKENILPAKLLDYLQSAFTNRKNVLISGGTGSGKTTLLNVLCEKLSEQERVISIEDTQELKIPVHNWVALEAVQKRKLANTLNVDLALLIRTTLRMRPDRIIVGEIRDSAAAMAFLQAINTGHCAASTVHANYAQDALDRVQVLAGATSLLPFNVIEKQLQSAIHLLVHMEQTPSGRKVTEVIKLVKCQSQIIYSLDVKL